MNSENQFQNLEENLTSCLERNAAHLQTMAAMLERHQDLIEAQATRLRDLESRIQSLVHMQQEVRHCIHECAEPWVSYIHALWSNEC